MLNSFTSQLPGAARRAPLALFITALWAAPALAAPGDPLTIYGGLGYFHDDNLFRLAENRPGFDNQRSDSARQTLAGIIFDQTYSRQKISLQAKFSKVKFDHFSQLDYDGKDLLANLNWQIGNHWEGSAGASYAQTLAPYTDLLTNQRNLREQRRGYADAVWRFHPSWRVRAAASRDRFDYELAVQRFNNRDEDAAEAGFDYLPRSGSTIGLVVRKLKGKYKNPRPIGSALLIDNFEQDELKAKVLWKVTPLSTVQVLAGYAKRKRDVSDGRDSSGFNGRLNANTSPTGKVRLNAAAWREFSALESSIVSYSLNRGASVGASWDATAKIKVDANASAERRSYDGRLLPNVPANLKDSIRQATLSATWSPARSLQLSTSVSHQRRSGDAYLGSGSFKANTVSVSAIAQF